MKAFGKSKTHYGLALSLDFDPQGAFLCMVVSPLSQKRWEQRSLDHLLKQSFAYLCPSRDSYLDNSHDYYLQCLQEKHWLFTVPVVTSISEGKQGADCKCLNWSPPISCLKKC